MTLTPQAAPLPMDAEASGYETASNWTATFSAPVSHLLLDGNFWREAFGGTNPVGNVFDQAFTILSGFDNATVLGGDTALSLPASGFYDGILQFAGPVSSLTVTSSPVCSPSCSLQNMAFRVANNGIPEPPALAPG